MKIPKNDLNNIYNSLMNMDDLYTKHKGTDKFLFLCHTVGCKIDSLKDLDRKHLTKIDALAMHIIALNRDKNILSLDQISNIKDKLDKIKTLLIKCIDKTFSVEKLYSNGKCIVDSIEHLVTLADIRVLGENFFEGLWDYKPVFEKDEFMLGEGMEEERVMLLYKDGKPLAIKSDDKLTPHSMIQILSQNYSDQDIYLSGNRKLKTTYNKIKKELAKNITGFPESIAWSFLKFIPAKEFGKLRNKKLCEGIKVSKHEGCPLFIATL